LQNNKNRDSAAKYKKADQIVVANITGKIFLQFELEFS
jgi:hypothetical protein